MPRGSAAQSVLVAREERPRPRPQREHGEREQAGPDGAGDTIPQAGGHPLGVQIDHLVEGLDEETDDDRRGMLLPKGHGLI